MNVQGTFCINFVKQRAVTCVLYMPDFIRFNGNDIGRETTQNNNIVHCRFLRCLLSIN